MGKRKGTYGSGMIIGAGTSVVICTVGLLVITKMMMLGKLDEKTVRYGIQLLVALAAGCGGAISVTISGKQLWLPVGVGCILTALVWLGSLIADGAYRNVVGIEGSVGLGIVLSCVLCLKKRSNSGRRKRGYR